MYRIVPSSVRKRPLLPLVTQPNTVGIAVFTKGLKPQTDLETRLVQQAALGSVRRNRASAAAEVLLRRRQRNAVRDWDETRDAEVAAWMARIDRDPAARPALLRTAEG